MRPIVPLLVLAVLFAEPLVAHVDGMTLQVARGTTPDEVVLAWSGGEPTFQVYRASDRSDVVNPANSIGEPEERQWVDTPGPGTIFYYQIGSPCLYDPPEVCNGIDDDCNGTVDDPGSEAFCALANATAVCASGACEVASCNPGFDDCNVVAVDGCETDLGSDPDSCGTCGAICSSNNITAPACAGGTCTGTCDPGFDDCDGDKRGDGCETSLDSLSDCGSCGNSCDDGDPCTGDFCSASTSCGHLDASACATPACASGCGFADTDGDGLNDTWETNGYIDLDCDGMEDVGVDTPLPDASPTRPDIYLEYDYMILPDSGAPCLIPGDCPAGQQCTGGICTGHSHEPDPLAVQLVVDAFALQGVELHIDPVHDALTHVEVITPEPLPPNCTGPDVASFYDLKAANMSSYAAPAYHYAVFAHESICRDESSCAACPALAGGLQPHFGATGMAEVTGDDLVVSFGAFVEAGLPVTDFMEGGTLMHELGHNLGLRHSGDTDAPESEPNYLSVMNPLYQFGIGISPAPGPYPTGPVDPSVDRRIDFSAFAHAPLEESGMPGISGGLDENAGVSGAPGSLDVVVFYGDLGATMLYAPGNGTPIDWNNNGNASEAHVVEDVSGNGNLELLTGHDDWGALEYVFQCVTGTWRDGRGPTPGGPPKQTRSPHDAASPE